MTFGRRDPFRPAPAQGVAACVETGYGTTFRPRPPAFFMGRGNPKELDGLRIADLISNAGRQFLSMEFFPPKQRETWPQFFAEVERLKALDPLFVSVTYGAGGGT